MTAQSGRTEGEPIISTTPNIDILKGIVERGSHANSGQIIEVRGGYYDGTMAVWVDKNLEVLLAEESQELPYLEAMAGVAIVTGELYQRQVKDGEEKVIWPQTFFDHGGQDLLLATAASDATFENPYCVHPNGAREPGIPYSIYYASYYERMASYIRQALDSGSQSAETAKDHLTALLQYYTVDEGRDGESERELVETTETTWVMLPEGLSVLPLTGSHEPYQDPLRIMRGEEPMIRAWVGDVRKRRFLPPWKVIAESRTTLRLDDDRSPVTREKIKVIAETSDKLYGPVGDNLRVITEFRMCPWASGIMAYQSTAKNLPNQEKIRGTIGYRNIVNTNIRDAGIQTQQIPLAERFFDENTWVRQQDIFARMRASVNLVSHEENHPRWVMNDSIMEELKSDILGVYAALMANNVLGREVFSFDDYQNIILTAVINGLTSWDKYRKALESEDKESADQLESYYRGHTMVMNYFYQNGVFQTDLDGVVIDIDINTLTLAKLQHLYGVLAEEFKDLHEAKKQPGDFFEPLFDESVWGRFRPLE